MNAKTQIRKRVTHTTLLENRIRLIFIHFCLFISITVYSQNTIKSIDGEDRALITRNMTGYNVHCFGTEDPACSSKNVFEHLNRIEVVTVSLVCFSNKKTIHNKTLFSDCVVSLISDSQSNKNISKNFISHSYAVRPPPYHM